MKRTVKPKQLRDLERLLADLEKLQGCLLSLVQDKTDAMKRADVPAMRELNHEEQKLIERLEEREGLRRQLMDLIGEQLGLPVQAARALSMSQLASRLPTQQRGKLLDTAAKLRAAVTKVAQANRVAGVIAREIMIHLKWVFASIRPSEASPVGYSGDGVTVAPTSAQILETIG